MGPFSMTNMVGVGRCNVRVQKAKMGRFLKNKARKKRRNFEEKISYLDTIDDIYFDVYTNTQK